MSVQLRVLFVEDSEDDALLLVRELTRGGYDPISERVASAPEMTAALDRQTWDLVISDHSLPQFSGTAALALLRDRGLDVPFIVVSGTITEAVAVAAMKAGANDYVTKGQLQRLLPAIERELREAKQRQARRAAEGAVQQSQDRLGAILESSLDAIVTINAASVVTGWSAQAEVMFGWPRAEAVGRLLTELVIPPLHREAHARGMARFLASGEGPILRRRIEITALHKEGHEFPVELTISPVRLGDSWEFSAFVRDLTERKRTEAALRESEATHATLVEHAPVGIYRSSPEGRFLSVNAALVRMLGYDSAAEVLELDMTRQVYADAAERQRLLDRDTYTDRESDEVEAIWKRKDGRPLNVQLNVRAVRTAAGRVKYYETIVRDVTEQRRLQTQLMQAQKMEAVGRLAGGVAHDFNNLLTAILGSADLLLDSLAPDSPDREEAEEVRKVALRAADLTRQLLAFSRQQVLMPKVLDLNEVVAGMDRMLRRLIGEDVDLRTTLAPGLAAVRADPSQLEQVIVNLAVNARDAMRTGGKLTIETGNVEMDRAYAERHGVAMDSGPCVMLAVTDTGSGMDAETQARIFEPFFTTKPEGKGTGLGLATVYGIVKQSGGFIWVYSEPGHGTTFKVYLPRVHAAVESVRAEAKEATSLRGSETILVVEDQAEVRRLTRKILEARGYTVLVAEGGTDALAVAERHRGTIHLLVTDVIMPGMSGREAGLLLAPTRPKMKVLYLSGYADESIVHHGVLEPGVAFLQKPFTSDTLARKVREVLDAVA